jgi:hypothetical protein
MKMWKVVLAVIAISFGILTSAHATLVSPDEVFAGHPGVVLACTPSQWDGSSNPVVKSMVILHNWNEAPLRIVVVHGLRSGQIVTRNEQYDLTHIGRNNDHSFDWAWFGNLKHNSVVNIKGELGYQAGKGWWYQETLFHGNIQDKVLPVEWCTVDSRFDRNPDDLS